MALSINVASAATSSANSATLTLPKSPAGDTLSINGNKGIAGDSGFVGLMERFSALNFACDGAGEATSLESALKQR